MVLSNPKFARYATLVVLVCVVLAVAMNSTGLFAQEVGRAAKLQQIAALVPSVFFIAAIWMVERAFRAISDGQPLELALVALLRRMGMCLFLGGLTFVFVQPWLNKLLLGATPIAWFDIPAITLGCLGLLMVVMARPLREAAEAQAELGEIV
mgnify:CR=1 FL=1|tara:strand:- start:2816 stop:3271 length:456 start_codon:yes stop_codon:yes gene_type:complete